jgi:TolB-like protein/Tfp pilus assembly protein PilF
MTPDSIRAHMRKIISSRALARSERLARFLEFTIGETLAGNAGQLKEFVIGVEVFDRRQDYDPRLDPIVRVEARRLRMKMRKYYETEGRSDALRIEFPKGSYAPAMRMAGATVSEPAARRGIAVLPFQNIGGREECEFFIDGLSEELIHALTKVEGLRVVAWNSSMKLKSTPRDYARVGEQLQVEVVLEGSVRPAGPGVARVAAQLVSVRDGSCLWAEAYEGPHEDAIRVRDEIAAAVARELRVKLSPPRGETRNVEAHTNYLKGRYHWNKRTDEAVARGAVYLEKAVEIDPNYALALAGVADSHIVLANLGAARALDAMPKARAAALRALEIDPTLAEAHVSLGSIASLFDWDWAAAEAHYRRGLQLNPGYATAHQWYAHDFLAAVGRLEEAEAEMALARECDPLSAVILSSSAEILAIQGRNAEAEDYYAKTLELDPYFPRAHFGLGRLYLLTGRHDEALASVHRGAELIAGTPMALALEANALGATGRVADAHAKIVALERLSRTARVAPYLMMRAWMAIDPERACYYLDQAIVERDPRLVHAAISPVYGPLHEQPSYEALLRQMKLSNQPRTSAGLVPALAD